MSTYHCLFITGFIFLVIISSQILAQDFPVTRITTIADGKGTLLMDPLVYTFGPGDELPIRVRLQSKTVKGVTGFLIGAADRRGNVCQPIECNDCLKNFSPAGFLCTSVYER